ncbi:hypothetical protein IAT38_003046 [Cryptococcus sp. DSM 104549]
MALNEFFADTTTGDWADDMDLPTAPAPRADTGPRKGEAGYLDSMPDRASRQATFAGAPQQREELPLPTVPPFTAFIGNLSFDADVEEQVREFFGDLKPVSVRMVKDPPTGKPKGFGYVEFPTQDGLKEALSRSMSQLQGRTIRVNVAEAPSTSRREAHPPSMAEEASQWRRSTPLPAREPAAGAGAPRRSGFTPAEPQADRDWSAARGARFVPAAPSPSGPGARREFGSGREPREPGASDTADKWRSNKPLAEARAAPGPGGRDLPPHQQAAAGGEGPVSPGLADTEQTWSRGTKLRTPTASEPTRSATASPGAAPAEEKDWRSARATPAASRQGSTDGESPRGPPAPVERRKLNLAPRTSSTAASPTASPSSAAPSAAPRSNIFGAAKPVDVAAKEKAAEEKLAQRDEERKKARAADAARVKEEAEKGRQLQEEKLRSIRAAQEKANAAVAGGKPQPARKASADKPKKDEQGFEAVSGARKASAGGAEAPRPKRDATTRPQFSFAAAAGSLTEEFVEGKDDAAEEEARKGLEGVTV